MIGTTGQLAQLLSARLEGPADLAIEACSNDTRQMPAGALYIPVRGEVHDGHDFIGQAWAAGAVATLAAPGALAQRGLTRPQGTALLEVPDPLRAFGRIGGAWRDRFPHVVMIGITGSLGKTSTKEFVWQILSQRGPVLRNESSFNNEVGVPHTLLRLRSEHWAAIQELGMRGPGQIAELAALVRPAVGLITNIGHSHLGMLGSRAAIADAKAELLDALPADGIAVLNADDELVRSIAGRHRGRTVWFGRGTDSEVRADDVALHGLRGASFMLHLPDAGRARVVLPVAGEHMVANALAAAALGHALGLPADAIAAALAAPPNLKLRGEIVHLASGARLINDAYNAAPESVRAALSILASEPTTGRRLAVLGAMAELGAESDAAHRQVGRDVANVVESLVTVGPLSAPIAAGAAEAGLTAIPVADVAEAAAWLRANLAAGDLVLLKGSRVFELERIVNDLEVAP